MLWNWEIFYHERLQMSSSKSSTFSVNGAWPPTGWCHAQFFPDSKSSISGLSNNVSLVSEFFWDGDQIAEIFVYKFALWSHSHATVYLNFKHVMWEIYFSFMVKRFIKNNQFSIFPMNCLICHTQIWIIFVFSFGNL